MGNPEHLIKLKSGTEAWNQWRKENRRIKPDLSQADLSGANLAEINLSGVDLRNTNLTGANLFWADLTEADLLNAKLIGANLVGADLSWVNLKSANLCAADLLEADLFNTKLNGANLRDTNLRSASLQESNLDGADLSNAKLWETQRARWSINGLLCERIYWDEKAKKPTEYSPGEFERLYSEQTTIELFYQDGISSFELNTLPALLQHLASKHPDASIHLKTIEQTGGGAKITISLGDADHSLKEKVENDALKIVKAQLTLRENENLRLQIQNDLLHDQYRETIRLMLSAGAQQIIFNAPVHTAAIPSGNARIELHQTFNDNTQLIELIENILSHNTELTAAQSSEVAEATSELKKPNPDKSRLSSFYDFLKSLPKEAILKGAGKLGERAAEADWSSLLHQLGEFIHHLS